ncbi:MAG: AAA family ATPase [Actinomycetota bacterium]
MVAPRIVGRERELTAVRALIDGLPHGGVLVVSGEPGVGKTTLLDVAISRAEAAGAAVARVSADEFSAARPLGLVPTGVIGTGFDADAVLGHLETMAGGRPCVVAFDDLQWADPASLALLGPMVRRGVSAGIAFVLAHRSWPRNGALDEMLDRVAPLAPTMITLAPLSTAEVKVLAELRVGQQVGGEVAELLHQAGGNPFYVLSLVNLLEADGTLDRSDPVARLVGRAPMINRSSLAASVVRRVALLGSGVERTLQHAALIGRSFPLTMLAALLEAPVVEVMSHLDTAVRGEVVQADGALFAFRHDLLREALAASLPVPAQMMLHRRIAELCEAAGDPAVAGVHLLRAELHPTDAGWLRRVAAHCAPTVSLGLIDRALTLLADDDPAHLRLAVERTDFLLWNGRPADAVEAARTLLDSGVPDDAAVQLRSTIAHALFVLGRAGEAVDSWIRAPLTAPAEIRALEAAELSFAAMFAGRLLDARRLATEARQLADDHTSTTVASVVLAYTSAAAGEVATALGHADTAVAHMDLADENARRLGPLVLRAAVRDFAGRSDDALADLAADEASGTADRGSVIREPFRLAVTATAQFRTGRWDDALATAEAGAQAADDLQVGSMDGWLSAVPMLVTLFRDGPTAAAAVRLPRSGGSLGNDWLMWAQALVHEAEGRSTEAVDLLHLVAAVGATLGSGAAALQVAPDLVRLARGSGRSELVAEVLELTAWGAVSGAGVDRPVPAVAERAWTEALAHGDAEGIADAARALGAQRPFSAARAWRDAAVIGLGRMGDTPFVREAAAKAMSAFDALGAVDAAARLRAGLRDDGVRLRVGKPASARVGWGAVTATERMVVELAAQGCSNAEIAARLYTSRRTVESHLVHVYAKVGVKSRVELARAAAAEWSLPTN